MLALYDTMFGRTYLYFSKRSNDGFFNWFRAVNIVVISQSVPVIVVSTKILTSQDMSQEPWVKNALVLSIVGIVYLLNLRRYRLLRQEQLLLDLSRKMKSESRVIRLLKGWLIISFAVLSGVVFPVLMFIFDSLLSL